MAVKLHRCSTTWAKLGGHPCWRAQKALDEAGIDYELVLHAPFRFRRPEVGEMTGGSRALPIVEFEDGSILRESKVIAERAQNGTLVPAPAPAAPTEPPAAPEPPPASSEPPSEPPPAPGATP
jgi:glutathione S-transferase